MWLGEIERDHEGLTHSEFDNYDGWNISSASLLHVR
jgi:hypothetical protein